MNRTVSVTVSEDALIEAMEWLRQKGLHPQAIAAIPRMCVEVIAKQLATEVSASTLGMYSDFGDTGRRSRPRTEGKRVAQGIVDYTPMDRFTQHTGSVYMQATQGYQPTPAPMMQALPADYKDYIQHVCSTPGLTQQTYTYEDWQMEKQQQIKQEIEQATKRLCSNSPQNVPEGCDPALPIAVNDTPEELNIKTAERRQREADEREALEKFNAEIMQQLTKDQVMSDES